MHYKAIFPGVHLEYADIPPDGSLTLRMTRVEQTTVEGDKGKASFKALITFDGPPWLQKNTWIAPVTVCRCIAAMFGDDTDGWLGKRVTLTAQTVDAFGDKVPAVRPTGSPDIERGLRVTVPKGRGKAYIELRKTVDPSQPQRPAKSAESDLRASLAVLLRDRVSAGTAAEADVRRECEESAICSVKFTDDLCAKLFPRGEVRP